MMYEDSPVKAPPPSRKMTPLQNSYSSFEGERAHFEVENQTWRKREKAPWQNSSSSSNERQWQVGLEEQRVAWSSSERQVMRAVENYLESSADRRVDVGVLERLIEPEDEEVCLRCISKHSTRRGTNIFQVSNTSEKETISWQTEGVGWSTKERG